MSTPTVDEFRAGVARDLADLDAKRDALVSEAEAILTRTAPDAPLPDDDKTRFEAIEEQLSTLAERRKAFERMMTTRVSLVPGTAFGDVHLNRGVTREDPWQRLADGATREADLPGLARSAVERVERADDDSKARAVALIEAEEITGDRTASNYLAAVSQPAYLRAFWRLASDPTRGQYTLSDAERSAVSVVMSRAASLTDASGGYALPFVLDPSIILTNAGSSNPVRAMARKVTTVSDTWNGVSSAGVSAHWRAEAEEADDDAPTLAQPSIPVHKADCFVPLSLEVGMDWANLEAEVRRLFADAKDNLEAAAFVTGTGSGQPTGIITELVGTSSIVPSIGANAFAKEDLYALASALPERHWPGAQWLAHRTTGFAVRQFAVGDESDAFWTDLGGSNPGRLIGKPWNESSEVDSTYGSGENYLLVIGDFENYVVVDRIGMSVEFIPHLFATANNRPSGQRGMYAFWRTGAESVNDDAFRCLNVT